MYNHAASKTKQKHVDRYARSRGTQFKHACKHARTGELHTSDIDMFRSVWTIPKTLFTRIVFCQSVSEQWPVIV